MGLHVGLLLVDSRGLREIVGAALKDGEKVGRNSGDWVGMVLFVMEGI